MLGKAMAPARVALAFSTGYDNETYECAPRSSARSLTPTLSTSSLASTLSTVGRWTLVLPGCPQTMTFRCYLDTCTPRLSSDACCSLLQVEDRTNMFCSGIRTNTVSWPWHMQSQRFGKGVGAHNLLDYIAALFSDESPRLNGYLEEITMLHARHM
jgi:hypothetical protein